MKHKCTCPPTEDLKIRYVLLHLCSPVKPYAPKNVTVLVEEYDKIPNLHVTWEPPFNVGVKSGWITLKYGLRVKQENISKWKVSEFQMDQA